jgi:N-acetylmuramoyl-L-alanine amidase
MEREAAEGETVTPPLRCLLPILFAPLLLSLLPFSASAAPASVTGIRFSANEDYTRIVVDLSREADFRANILAADPVRNLPPRIFVDIEGSDARDEVLEKPLAVGGGPVRIIRAGRFREGTVRVVLDLERESPFRAFALVDPSRIIIDVEGVGTPEPPRPPSAVAGSATPSRIRVMLDPGHGGKDPGAIGPTGLKEKDIVLAIGQRVREKLLASGEFDVMMTRDTDVFIPLDERTRMANDARVDIFVSIHINASRNRDARGISTYVLSRASDASDREALEVAARENGVPVRKLSAVNFILSDLSLYGRKNESLRLAKTVNDAIVRNVKTRFGDVHDLGLKQAPFYVLVGARMTAVLVEASFITNPREERRLRDRRYRETIADSIVEAIRYYGSRSLMAQAGT